MMELWAITPTGHKPSNFLALGSVFLYLDQPSFPLPLEDVYLSNSSHLTFPQQLLYVGGFLLSLPKPEILQKQRPIISFLLPQFVH